MVNLTAAERVYEYWIDKASSAADLVLKIVFAVILFLVARKLILWLCGLIRKNMRRFHTEEAVVSFTVSMVKYSLNTLLVLTIIVQLGIVSEASIAAAIASAGVAVSLALQGGLSNFAGGVMILLLKPFAVGDYIIEDTNGKEGTVKEIQIFYTKLTTIDNKTIVIPNGMLTNNSITNASAKDERQLDLRVGISYDADIKKVKSVIENVLVKDASIIKNEQILVFVDDLADSAVVLGIRAWVKNEEYWDTRWRMLEEIKLALDENEIEIPYPQMTVHMSENA